MNNKPALIGGESEFPRSIPFARPTLPPFEELEQGLRDIVESGMVTKGKYLKEYEKAISDMLETPYCLGVVNCTMGLFMLLKALGIKGEVIVPSFTFMSSFHVIELLGLTPVFVDCEKDTFTIDPQKVEEAITPETSAIMAVSIFGNPPDIKSLEDIAGRHNLKFIMDSAHSFGTLYYGRPMGSYGDGEVFSTSATKLVATGEGGVISTKHKEIYEFIKIFREYGNTGDYNCEVAGINGRLSEFHALLGLKAVPKLEEMALARNHIAKTYRENLTNMPGIIFQKIRDGCRSSYKDFAVIIDDIQFGLNRDTLATALLAEGIPTRKYFHPPGHLQKVYRKYKDRYTGRLEVTEYLSKNSLILPVYSHMSPDTVRKIVNAVEKIYRFAPEIRK
ncbi:MAG: DegT/DnrJ/EryC1/StrS family aminotransferase [Candidatus Eremiobacteraeota bacterium]|nr:DegT/DnrJ/EryC1/StrS family aminotransferase [Candidatus Eremiobacteraeota bacterium]